VLVLAPLGYGTLETEIYRQTADLFDLRHAAVLSVLQVLVVAGTLVLLALARRSRDVALRLQTDDAAARPLRRADLPAVLVTAAVVAGLVLLPLVSLLSGALRVGDAWGLGNFRALSRTLGSAGLEVSAWQATLNSLRIAVDATVVAVVLGVLVSLLLSRRPRSRPLRRAHSVFDGLFMLPLGVSAVTVGFGFLVTLYRPPLDLGDSVLLVPIAQAGRRPSPGHPDPAAGAARHRLPHARGGGRARRLTPAGAHLGRPAGPGPLAGGGRRARVRGQPRRVRRHHLPGAPRPGDAAGRGRAADHPAGRGQPRDGAGRFPWCWPSWSWR
jgi:ABC-type spermidine/putrescine transport system permease subunit II